MEIVQWDDTHSVDNADIDNEHKIFVKIIQKINVAMLKQNKEQSERFLQELIKFADFHFTSEENLMCNIQFDDRGDHKTEHQHLLFALRQKLKESQNSESLDEGLIPFLVDWFARHATHRDLLLAKSIAAAQKAQ